MTSRSTNVLSRSWPSGAATSERGKRYGLSIGNVSPVSAKRFPVARVRLNRNGYDSHGRYYGTGAPLFEVSDEDDDLTTRVRAASAAEARKKAIAEWMRSQNWSGEYGRKVWSPTARTIHENYR